MTFTKNQILNFLEKKRNEQNHSATNPIESSIKYWTIGTLHLLVQNDLISLAQVYAEFPELA